MYTIRTITNWKKVNDNDYIKYIILELCLN